MPITKSAQKALRQSKRRKVQNTRRKTKFRSLVKEFRKAVSAKDFDKAKQMLPGVYKALDKAAKTDALKKNTANRNKSRLARLLSKSST